MTGRESDGAGRRAMVPGFALISGTGWLIDFALFNTLVAMGGRPGRVNIVSAGVALTFVFVVSRRRLFADARRPVAQAMALYGAYNVVALAAASALVGALSGVIGAGIGGLALPWAAHLAGLGPACAKIAVTPLTMYANFVALAFINLRQVRWV